MRRRTVLSVVGVLSSVGLSGCAQGDGPGDAGDSVTPTTDVGGNPGGTDVGGDGDAGGTDVGGDSDATGGDGECPEWSSIEPVDLAEFDLEDFPVIPSYPPDWEGDNAFLEPDEGILAVADPDREPTNPADYVSVQVRLVDAEGDDVPSREDWPTRDWELADDEADPVTFEGEERPVGIFEEDIGVTWEFTAIGPNDTFVLVNVIVRYGSEACRDTMGELGRAVLDALELNDDSAI